MKYKRPELIKQLTKVFEEKLEEKRTALTWKRTKTKLLLDRAQICGIIPCNEYTYELLVNNIANQENDWREKIEVDYLPKDKQEIQSKYAVIYLQELIKIVKIVGGDSVRMKINKNHPLTIEVREEEFQFDLLLAPRVDEE